MSSGSLFNSKYNLEFWHIPKNAMTTIIHQLKFNWEVIEKLPSDRKIFCILRDPLSRFLSSYLMVRHLYKSGNHRYNLRKFNNFFTDDIFKDYETYTDEILSNGHFDAHNTKQLYFIDKYIEKGHEDYERKIENVTDFIIFDNMDEELSLLTNDSVKLQTMNKSSIDTNIKNQLKEMTNNELSDKILTYHKDDLLLYEKIKRQTYEYRG
jgi:hypothetical protein